MGYHSRSGLDAGPSAQALTTGSFNETKGYKKYRNFRAGSVIEL